MVVASLVLGSCSVDSSPNKPPSTDVRPIASAATVRPEFRDIYETVRIEGIVEPYDVQTVVAPRSGNFVPAPGLANGATVKEGATLGRIEGCAALAETAPSAPGAPSVAPQCVVSRATVRAPISGILSGLYQQQVAGGAAVAGVQPSGFHIRMPVLDPASLFNFEDPPKSGKALLVGGPSGFVVGYEKLVYVKESGAVNVYASIPAEIKAFAGLHAVVVFVTGVKTEVLTLPLSAVRGRSGTGQVVTVDGAGHRKAVPVTIGDADDAFVEVSGVEVNVEVLLYPLESDFGE
jgi:hypothetical protein